MKIEKLKEKVTKIADKVFIGAGGHSIPLLQKSGVKQREHLGGFQSVVNS